MPAFRVYDMTPLNNAATNFKLAGRLWKSAKVLRNRRAGRIFLVATGDKHI